MLRKSCFISHVLFTEDRCFLFVATLVVIHVAKQTTSRRREESKRETCRGHTTQRDNIPCAYNCKVYSSRREIRFLVETK